VLNLTRRPGEGIKLSGVLSPGQQVLISVNEIRGQSVKVGIAAPPGVVINRADAARGIAPPVGRDAPPRLFVQWEKVTAALERAADEMTRHDPGVVRDVILEVRRQLRGELTP